MTAQNRSSILKLNVKKSVMWQFPGVFLKNLSFLLSLWISIYPANWNLHVMMGAPTAFLDHEDEGYTSGMAESRCLKTSWNWDAQLGLGHLSPGFYVWNTSSMPASGAIRGRFEGGSKCNWGSLGLRQCMGWGVPRAALGTKTWKAAVNCVQSIPHTC